MDDNEIVRNITIGADPEVFVRQTRTGAFVSAHDMPGTKARPFATQHGAVQVDGCALEFNIHPAKTKADFLRNLYVTYSSLDKMLKERHPDCELAIMPTARFGPKYWETLPKEVKVMGCDPDFCAYTMQDNEPPEQNKPMRSAGGHVHIGWTKVDDPMSMNHMYECAAFVRQLDSTLFVGSLQFDEDYDRRTLYGAPGAFRPKEYGVEYRVLSNAWIRNPTLAEWVYDTTVWSIQFLTEGRILSEDDYLKNIISAARKKPNVFYADKREQSNAYKYLLGLGMPEVPANK